MSSKTITAPPPRKKPPGFSSLWKTEPRPRVANRTRRALAAQPANRAPKAHVLHYHSPCLLTHLTNADDAPPEDNISLPAPHRCPAELKNSPRVAPPDTPGNGGHHAREQLPSESNPRMSVMQKVNTVEKSRPVASIFMKEKNPRPPARPVFLFQTIFFSLLSPPYYLLFSSSLFQCLTIGCACWLIFVN